MTVLDWVHELTTSPVSGAVIALGGVYLTRRTTKSEGAANRADKRTDQLREEVAGILAERPKMLDSRQRLYSAQVASRLYSEGKLTAPEVPTPVLAVRDAHIELCDEVRHKVIRAKLLTRDPAIEAALEQIDEAAQGWGKVIGAASTDAKGFDRYTELQNAVGNAFDALESSTRAVTTADGKGSAKR
ncbi:hypothetical protein [Smaragdicoccus niigatensis]|uniref:hypothetical protein n=1 Tax=Smaragdicoccus niigatensis TaxID=359359 RepID=UPI0003668691|nr:hypothetical protein [Smaragdicoccus niigatensis]